MIEAVRAAAGFMLFVCVWFAAPAMAAPIGGAVNHVTIWTPDYFGQKIWARHFDYTVDPATFTTKTVLLSAKGCNPNAVAVAVASGNLYVVCNGDFGNPDQILVYNASTLAFVKKITGLGTDGQNYFTGGSLIAILFDSRGNLWVSGYAGNDLLRIPSGQLSLAVPKVDRQVINSPDSPAGLAMDADKSIWVVGQYLGGIVLNFTDAVLNAPGIHLGASALNPTPRFCISNAAGGCQQSANLFNNPEGVAVFDGNVWVSNNGGNAPAATIVRLGRYAGGLVASTFGSVVNRPFACPGGMFSAMVPGGTPTLWVNDEGYNVANTDCGASNADQGERLGRVLEFLPNDLLLHRVRPTPETFTNWNWMQTSSPGFGGIFVQMD